MNKLSVVIPAYNEEKRIEESLKKLYEFFSKQDYEYEIIISDDGSTDSTKDIVRKYISRWPQLQLLENSHKGKAPAIIAGIRKANAKYVLFTDIDLSVAIDETPKFLNWVESQDFKVAIATREGTGAKRINEPYLRHFMGRIFNLLVQVLVLPSINDTQCGFKLFETSLINKILDKSKLYTLDDPEIKGGRVGAFDIELLFLARKMGYKIKEVPVTWIYGDSSKVHKLNDSYYNAKDVLKVRFNYLKGLYK